MKCFRKHNGKSASYFFTGTIRISQYNNPSFFISGTNILYNSRPEGIASGRNQIRIYRLSHTGNIRFALDNDNLLK